MSSTVPMTTINTSPRTLSKPAELLLKIAMAVISPLLLIALLEGVAYLWEQGQANGIYAWELVASRRLEWVQYPEPGAGYTLMKPGSHYEWQGIPVDINSRGLRSPETAYEKPPNTYRILNLGDSIAMGWGVKAEDTYGQQLEKLLNEQQDDNLHYETINAGVPGWNLENELAYLQAEGLKYQPDLILLDITIVNDIYGKSALLKQNRPGSIEWLRTNTYLWPFLTIQLRWVQARVEGRERIDVINPPTEAASYFPLDSEAQRYQEIWDWILTMNRLAEENNADFILLLFPLEYQVLDDTYSTVPQDFFNAKVAEANIQVIDLLPLYRQACLEKPDGLCQLEERYLFADVWMHPSAYGHKLAAIELESLISEALKK
jgi:hypothetical protein